MNIINDNRVTNLRALFAFHGGPTNLSRALGHANASFVVQIAGPNPRRPVSDRTARKIEQQLDLPLYAMDASPELVEVTSLIGKGKDQDAVKWVRERVFKSAGEGAVNSPFYVPSKEQYTALQPLVPDTVLTEEMLQLILTHTKAGDAAVTAKVIRAAAKQLAKGNRIDVDLLFDIVNS